MLSGKRKKSQETDIKGEGKRKRDVSEVRMSEEPEEWTEGL